MIKSDFKRHSKEEEWTTKKLELILNQRKRSPVEYSNRLSFIVSTIFYTNEHLFYESEIEFRRFCF